MRAIYKYQIPGAGRGPVAMPKGATILFAREQNNIACIWALVDPDAELTQRTLMAVETGVQTVSDDSRYIGTCILDGGAYVLHVFEPKQLSI